MSQILQPCPIILASASPRRKVLLQALGLDFRVHTADIDEQPHPQETPVELVCRLSQEKGAVVATQYPQALILAADTIVVLDDQILGKPATPEDAHLMLTALRGRTHDVYSAFSAIHQATACQQTVLSQTTVTMRSYADAEIASYIASGDPMDKAGAYAIQNRTFAPVAHLDGCYAGVMGLSLKLVAQTLQFFGFQLNQVASKCQGSTNYICCENNSSRKKNQN